MSNNDLFTLSDNIEAVPFNGYLTELEIVWPYDRSAVHIVVQVWRPKPGNIYQYVGHVSMIVRM